MINETNWTYLVYKNEISRVFISLGGKLGSDEKFEELYFVTQCNPDYEEIFQKEFTKVAEACSFINLQYGHLELLDQRISTGCSTCHAH